MWVSEVVQESANAGLTRSYEDGFEAVVSLEQLAIGRDPIGFGSALGVQTAHPPSVRPGFLDMLQRLTDDTGADTYS
jgi:hypothetical protein